MKQIDEMAEIIGVLRFHNTSDYIAERLYNAGYRKQSEVAREIFEEIENLLSKAKPAIAKGMAMAIRDQSSEGFLANEGALTLYAVFKIAFAELKKKYTEG